MKYSWSLFVFALSLLVFAFGASCETARSPHATETNDGSDALSAVNEPSADTVFVRRIGYMSQAELYERFMNNDIIAYDIYAYAEAVADTRYPGAVDSLLRFAERYPGDPRYYAVKVLMNERTPKFGPWLRAHAGELGLSFWSEIGSTLAHSGWRDSVVAEVLMEQLHQNKDARARIARAFVGMGTLDEVRTIVAINDTTSSKWLEWTAIAAQARFDVPEFNKSVRAALQDTSRLHTRMLEGLEQNHRHDFLPELREVRETLDSKRPDYFLGYLDELIAELEENKEAGVSPGAPLDYPNTTRADSTAQ